MTRRLGHFRQFQDLAIAQEYFAVELHAGQRARFGTGGKQDVRGFDFRDRAVAFSTATRPGPAQRPQPCIVSTLFLRNRNSMPLACLSTILFLRASTAGQFRLQAATSMPNSSAFLQVS